MIGQVSFYGKIIETEVTPIITIKGVEYGSIAYRTIFNDYEGAPPYYVCRARGSRTWGMAGRLPYATVAWKEAGTAVLQARVPPDHEVRFEEFVKALPQRTFRHRFHSFPDHTVFLLAVDGVDLYRVAQSIQSFPEWTAVKQTVFNCSDIRYATWGTAPCCAGCHALPPTQKHGWQLVKTPVGELTLTCEPLADALRQVQEWGILDTEPQSYPAEVLAILARTAQREE